MSRMLRVALGVTLLSVPSWALDRWKPHSPPEDGGNDVGSADCGGVDGEYGAYVDFELWSLSTTLITSHGTIGGSWNGAQYELATVAPPEIHDQHNHNWIKEGGGSPSATTLRAQSTTGQDSNGSCGQMNQLDSQWWWRPTVSASVEEPKIQRFNTGTGNWDDQNWAHNFGDAGDGSYSATQPTGQETAPATATYNTLNRRSAYTLPQSSAGVRYRVGWALHTTVSASVDNATVTLWRQGLHVDCASQISAGDPDEDFDLW